MHQHRNVLFVFKPVADNGRVVVGDRHHGHQFRFRSGFETELVRLSVFENLFDNLPLLVHFDGKYAAVFTLVAMLADGGLKRTVNFTQPVLQNLAEAEQDRRLNAAKHELIDQFLQIDAACAILVRMDPEVAVFRHGKIAFAPAHYVIQLGGIGDGPPIGRLKNLCCVGQACVQLLITSPTY